MVCAGGCNSVFVFILITCLNIKEKSTVDVEAPSVGQMFRSLLQNDQAMTVVVTIVLINCSIYITSNLVIYFFKYDFGGDSWYNAYTLFNTFGGAMQILAMMLFFPILRKFLGTIQVFYTSFVMAILGYAVLLILMFVNMSNLYLLFVPAFFYLFSKWNVIRSHNGIPCEYGRLRRVEESQKG